MCYLYRDKNTQKLKKRFGTSVFDCLGKQIMLSVGRVVVWFGAIFGKQNGSLSPKMLERKKYYLYPFLVILRLNKGSDDN